MFHANGAKYAFHFTAVVSGLLMNTRHLKKKKRRKKRKKEEKEGTHLLV